MIADVEAYCCECLACQAAKPSAPQPVPLTSVPIGKLWQMVAVDILEVPRSPKNIYLSCKTILPSGSRPFLCLTKLHHGLPMNWPRSLLHLDSQRLFTQGRNFESTILRHRPLRLLVFRSHEPLSITHRAMEWWNGSTGLCSKCCAPMSCLPGK